MLQIVVGGALALLGLTALRLRGSSNAARLPRLDDEGRLARLGSRLRCRGGPQRATQGVAPDGGRRADRAHRVVGGPGDRVAIVFFTVVATSTVMAPVLLTFLAPARMEPRLVAARRWLEANGPAVTAITMLVIGILVILLGLTHL